MWFIIIVWVTGLTEGLQWLGDAHCELCTFIKVCHHIHTRAPRPLTLGFDVVLGEALIAISGCSVYHGDNLIVFQFNSSCVSIEQQCSVGDGHC